jgi:hypothetical protein
MGKICRGTDRYLGFIRPVDVLRGICSRATEAQVYAEGILSVCRFYVESPLECASGISGSDLKRRIVRIMSQSLADKLSFGRKALLRGVGIAVVAGPVVFGLVSTSHVLALLTS